MPPVKIWLGLFMIKPDSDAKRWNLWESNENEEEGIVVVEGNTRTCPMPLTPNPKENLNSNYPKMPRRKLPFFFS